MKLVDLCVTALINQKDRLSFLKVQQNHSLILKNICAEKDKNYPKVPIIVFYLDLFFNLCT